jgi:hypothetical protein
MKNIKQNIKGKVRYQSTGARAKWNEHEDNLLINEVILNNVLPETIFNKYFQLGSGHYNR